MIRNGSKEQILPLITSRIDKGTKVFTDGFKTYDSLVDLGYKKHYRVHQRMSLLRKKGKKKIKNHINGIENFWGIAKVRLYKFRGMDKKNILSCPLPSFQLDSLIH